ncbi:hypothetical protein Anapl_06047 [Anas platyrhynchos]|uniref:Uncharacterized protein n=1 Tax=Anas platyrhynchos TaxID=8839 RepID=R0M093_ANAPL|nr:hypothetical protein Anapl_06047 [Anas platyrhynchos]
MRSKAPGARVIGSSGGNLTGSGQPERSGKGSGKQRRTHGEHPTELPKAATPAMERKKKPRGRGPQAHSKCAHTAVLTRQPPCKHLGPHAWHRGEGREGKDGTRHAPGCRGSTVHCEEAPEPTQLPAPALLPNPVPSAPVGDRGTTGGRAPRSSTEPCPRAAPTLLLPASSTKLRGSSPAASSGAEAEHLPDTPITLGISSAYSGSLIKKEITGICHLGERLPERSLRYDRSLRHERSLRHDLSLRVSSSEDDMAPARAGRPRGQQPAEGANSA